MIWRRYSNTDWTSPEVGEDPPPLRPLYPACDCLKVWCRVKYTARRDGVTVGGTGDWTDWSDDLSTLAVLANTSNDGTHEVSASIEYQLAGRIMPVMLVIEDKRQNFVPPTDEEIIVRDPIFLIAGGENGFADYPAPGSGKQLLGNRVMICIPAEGII